jgi:hypothetical protein
MLYPTELRARKDLGYTADPLISSVKVASKFHSALAPRVCLWPDKPASRAVWNVTERSIFLQFTI